MSREDIAKSMLALGSKTKLYKRRGFWGRLFYVGVINPKLKPPNSGELKLYPTMGVLANKP